MHNRIELIGRLGRNAELKHLATGAAVANFSIATTESWKDKGGQKQETTTWFDVAIWGKLAEAIERYLEKGVLVFVAGPMRMREYQNKDGVTVRAWTVNAETVRLLGGGKARHRGAGGDADPNEEHHVDAPDYGSPGEGGGYPDDDPIPF